MAAWAESRGLQVTRTRIYDEEPLPQPQDCGILAILGGPMGVHDVVACPWMDAELHYIEKALQCGTPILGICLGAQMLAHVLGADVHDNPHREIGWFSVDHVVSDHAMDIHNVLADQVTAFHWHGQTFDIPRGAVHLARSEACNNQAFLYGDHALALQYHLETTPQAAQALIDHCAEEMIPGPFVQSPDAILARPERFTAMGAHMTKLLDWLTRPAAQ